MKTGRPLQELAVELDRQNKAKRDFIVPASSITMSDARLWLDEKSKNSADDLGGYGFGMSDLAHRQLAEITGIPAKYYDKCREASMSLLSEYVEYWLHRSGKRHMIRTLDSGVRAILSDRYRRIDNFDIAQTTLPVIGNIPGARIESCEITENRMYIKAVNPRLTAEVIPGDVVQAGIVISNSEVGLGSVSVMPLVFRLVCSNGMIVQDHGQRKYHIGRAIDDDWELFSDETLAADDVAFMLKLADITRTAVDEAKFAVIVDTLREAAQSAITAPAADVIELTGRQFGFTKPESDGILQHLIEGGDLSMWGLSNAVTRTAADVESYDRATALECVGWQIVTMDPRAWREINRI